MKYASEKPEKCSRCKHSYRGKCLYDTCYYRLTPPKNAHPCIGCHYCDQSPSHFPCWKDLMGERGISTWQPE